LKDTQQDFGLTDVHGAIARAERDQERSIETSEAEAQPLYRPLRRGGEVIRVGTEVIPPGWWVGPAKLPDLRGPAPGDTAANAKANTGLRFNAGKPMLSLIDPEFLVEMAKVMTKGAEKYARDNWRKGLPISGIDDCLLRHQGKAQRRLGNDEESGCSHYAHVAINAMFAWWMEKYRPDLDDRFVAVK
jgi:hypothetical protein